jgi:hypothetical protein
MDGESGVLPQKEKKHKLIGGITLFIASHQWQWTQQWNLKIHPKHGWKEFNNGKENNE